MGDEARVEIAGQFRAQQVRRRHVVLHIARDAARARFHGGRVVQAEDGQAAVACRFRVARLHRQGPAVRDGVIGAQLRVFRLRLEIRPVRADQLARIDGTRQGDHAFHGGRQGHARLLRHPAAVVFQVRLQQQLVRHAPVQRGGHEAAVAVAHIIQIRTQGAASGVDAHAEFLLRAKAAADVHVCHGTAPVVETQAHARDGLAARPLGDEIDDAGRRGEAVVQGRGALQHFHPLLVFHGHLRKVHDGHGTVQAVIRAVFHGDAAYHQLIPRFAAVLLARHARRVAHGIVQAGHGLLLQQFARDDVDGRWHVHDVGATEAARLRRRGHQALRARPRHLHGLHDFLIASRQVVLAVGPIRGAGRVGSEGQRQGRGHWE